MSKYFDYKFNGIQAEKPTKTETKTIKNNTILQNTQEN